MHLFYEQPDAARAVQIADKLTAVLGALGLATTTTLTTTTRSTSWLRVVGRVR